MTSEEIIARQGEIEERKAQIGRASCRERV